ncbi:hypothetical protein CkP1_0280 [Citrobacter phage CkP1]|nr:hypothetical protein CkP1_0280 [Citrobacter phage CkP1]
MKKYYIAYKVLVDEQIHVDVVESENEFDAVRVLIETSAYMIDKIIKSAELKDA